jgi:hypothetical protein
MNPGYLELAARNGLLDECDFLSLHYYGDPLGLEQLVTQYREWLAQSGHAQKPLWLTEAGLFRRGNADIRPSPAEQAGIALTYAMQAVEAHACGFTRFAPFLYPTYSMRKGTIQFGLVDKNLSPLRALAASAQAGRALAGMDYIGDLPMTAITMPAKRIRVFTPNRQDKNRDAWVVVYTGKATHGARLYSRFNIQEARGIDGRLFPPARDGREAPIPDGISYLRVNRREINKILLENTAAMRLYRLSRATPEPLPPASSILLQPQIDTEKIKTISSLGYFLQDGTTRFPVKVGINNLGSKTQTIKLHIAGAPDTTVTIAAGSRKQVLAEIDIASLSTNTGGAEIRLPVKATSNDNTRIGPAELTLILPDKGGIAEHLQAANYHYALALNETWRWEKKSSGKLTFSDKTSKVWGYSADFPEATKDRWAYPRFTLPLEADMSRVTGVLLQARSLRPATVKLISWDETGKQNITHDPVIPADGEWHLAYISLRSFLGFVAADSAATRLKQISIGFNTEEKQNTIEISNLYLIGR